MTVEQFLQDFCCRLEVQDHGNAFVVITEAIRRRDNAVIARVKTTIDIQQTSNWIMDSNTMVSVTPFDWNTVADYTKRAQLDYFAQRVPIDNWYPLNRQENPDISNLYC